LSYRSQKGTRKLKRLIFAAAILASASTTAIADEVWVQHNDFTCHIPQYSLADTFKMFSDTATIVGLPQPQIDYTSGAAVGATILHYFNPKTRQSGAIMFWDSRAQCEAGVARGKAWIGAGKPAL
jgi:hypothetical protein